MKYKLKTISQSGIGEALAQAQLCRSLSEPEEAESICRDVLAIEPENQLALRVLGLAITDQFIGLQSDRFVEAEQIFQRLHSEYERIYCTGLTHERRAKAELRAGHLSNYIISLFVRALGCFSKAEKISPDGNDEAILRWNSCVRLLQSKQGILAGYEMAPSNAGDSSAL
jgi:tetratricopeptide (TPR) repeat protein